MIRQLLKFWLKFWIALVLALTAPVMAASRNAPDAAMTITICSDGALKTIQLDAQGAPVGVAHWCPDCILADLPAVLPADLPGAHLMLVAKDWQFSQQTAARTSARLTNRPARGPPA